MKGAIDEGSCGNVDGEDVELATTELDSVGSAELRMK